MKTLISDIYNTIREIEPCTELSIEIVKSNCFEEVVCVIFPRKAGSNCSYHMELSDFLKRNCIPYEQLESRDIGFLTVPVDELTIFLSAEKTLQALQAGQADLAYPDLELALSTRPNRPRKI